MIDHYSPKHPLCTEKLMGRRSKPGYGAELSILFPWMKINQELVLGATNGRVWGHSHSAGPPKK